MHGSVTFRPGFRIRIRIRSDPVFLNGSGSGSGSGFQISLDPDVGPDSAQILEQKNCRKVSKSYLSEENLKFMTKDRQKMKKATISN